MLEANSAFEQPILLAASSTSFILIGTEQFMYHKMYFIDMHAINLLGGALVIFDGEKKTCP